LNLTPGKLLLCLAEESPPQLESFSTAGGKRLRGFGLLLSKWRQDFESLPPVEIVDQILSDVDYRTYIEDGSEEGYDRWENIVELRRLASEYQNVGLFSFLEDVALVSDQDTLETNLEVPTLLTLHAAKGLEFGQVMIIGLNDGILPHQRSFDDPEAMEEERRLFYVGITRAIDHLYLFHSLNRYTFGYFEPLEPSRYYRDIPPELRVENGYPVVTRFNDFNSTEMKSWREMTEGEVVGETLKTQYYPGLSVKHSTWGKGLVLNSVIQDDDEILDIFFESVGKKKLIASLADLEIVDS
jgi:DNA helicase-2/ATP-dependent DNA helicase PcrA